MSEEVKIERMSYGADSIAHLPDGKTVFVEGGVPGDVVCLEILSQKDSYCKARIKSIVEPSSFRVDSLPKDAIACGAMWAHLSYECQLRAKENNVEEALVRTGGISRDELAQIFNPIIACEREWNYRNKIELAAYNKNGKFFLGSHEAGTDRNIPLTYAPLAEKSIAKAPKALTGVLRYLQGRGDLGIYRVGVRASSVTKSVEVALWTPPSSFPRNFAAKSIEDAIGATSVVRILAFPGKERRVKKVEVLDGDGYWRERMDDAFALRNSKTDISECVWSDKVYFHISAPSFFQVNTQQAQVLVNTALTGLGVFSDMHIADIYSGAGTFSIPLALAGCKVSAVEIAGNSVSDLRRNMNAAKADIDIICDDALRGLDSIGCPDAVLVDPPRIGLEKEVIEKIAAKAPERIAYVSCDPQTFARDIRRFSEKGYKLCQVTPVDMFPQTYHVETVGILNRE